MVCNSASSGNSGAHSRMKRVEGGDLGHSLIGSTNLSSKLTHSDQDEDDDQGNTAGLTGRLGRNYYSI
jgi:hypothetical protein